MFEMLLGSELARTNGCSGVDARGVVVVVPPLLERCLVQAVSSWKRNEKGRSSKRPFSGDFVELDGIEPTTSRVRF